MDANGFHDWVFGAQGCYGALACPGMPGIYRSGSYANEEAPPFPDYPKSTPDKFRPKGRSGAKENVDDGSIWEKDYSGHAGSEWKRWPNEKSWERGDSPNSIWGDGRVRK